MAEDLIDYELDGDAPDDIEPIQGEPELYEHFRTVVDKGQAPVRIDKYLFERIVNASRNRIQMAADNGFVMANGKPVKSSYKVKPLDVLTVMMDRPRYENDIIPEDIPLNIVYEDDDLMVINKPAGLVVHPGCGNYHGTLVNAIAWHLRDVPTYNPNDPQVGLVHRIDKDTSGLLVVAKTPDAKTSLGLQFYNKTTKREYNALVWGIVEQDEGTITGNIGRNPRDRMQMAVMSDPEQGKHAVTHYQVLERLGYVTLVKCVLETGRTHQIRVHMKHIGHTLFNDERYGGHEILKGTHFSKYKQFVNNCFEICPRQALHAKTLGFVHPRTGEEMFFTSELPEDMTCLLERWRTYITSRFCLFCCNRMSSLYILYIKHLQLLFHSCICKCLKIR
ncbi:RluA family pseudouridine synthase [Bacteroides sp. ET225]|uniref:RluA family pseudouridine synthase n=1 Tax=Bacteroides sp. ET225 TaxID=2972461 RepID=UPI0021ABD3EF|nr:RluA family pseudouridine synthase [Bacteroides sp. ET225]MCR8918952.1 RluA family pseudouridine synthase [Bacteroides sp. ET225]